MTDCPDSARVVVIGGGIVGCSLLHHLAEEGWQDCLLVEKGELTSGSTWHAAGAITHGLADAGLARMAGYGIRCYQALERETGQSVSWHGCGSLRLAYDGDELDQLRRMLDVGRALDHPMEIVGPDRIGDLHPFYRPDGVRAALHTPADGHLDPAGAALAFAAGARLRGARISRRNRVLGLKPRRGGGWRVVTAQGEIVCDMVVNAAGTYARQVGEWVGLDLPVCCATHQYLVTEPLAALAALDKELPVLRDGFGMAAYFRQEQNAVLMGFYQKQAPHLVWLDGTPWSAENALFDADLDAVMPSVELALERMPLLADAGIRRVVNGAIPYTPDGRMLLGPAGGVPGFWCACGVSIGVGLGAGIGRYLAQLMVHGAAEISMRPFDPRRFGSWADRAYAVAKVSEDYVLRHEIAFPGRNRPAARPVRRSTLYGELLRKGAVFEQLAGWERPLWFAGADAPDRPLSFRRTAVVRRIAAEARAVRERAGILDLSGFAKLDVFGPDAATLLDRLICDRLPAPGRTHLAYMLTSAGTIDAEITCTRIANDRFYLLYAALDERRVIDRLEEHGRQLDLEIDNLSEEIGCLLLAGPRAREVMGGLADEDVSAAAFPPLAARLMTVAGVALRALRVSLVGEVSFELHAPMADLPVLYRALRQAGEAAGITDFGTAALNGLRFETGHKGSAELNGATSLVETGMMRFADLAKGKFVGRDALLARPAAPAPRICCQLEIQGADADCQGGEAVIADGRVAGSVSSGAFGPYLGRSLAFAFVTPDCLRTDVRLGVTILGETHPAKVLEGAAYSRARPSAGRAPVTTTSISLGGIS